jgi:hypothetical protein
MPRKAAEDPTVRHYDGSGRYELRDPHGRLKARGDLEFCYSRLELETGIRDLTDEANRGWQIIPELVDDLPSSGTE